MEINYIEKTLKIISENNYLALATAGKSGKPWVATVFYAFDDECNFYFFSAKDSLHAKQIRENPSAAVSIFNSMLPPDKVDGVQIECKAEQARIVDLPHLISVYYQQRGEETAGLDGPLPRERGECLHHLPPLRCEPPVFLRMEAEVQPF